LIAHLRNPATLSPAQARATHFAGSFQTIAGATDTLPAVSDPAILEELLLATPFTSARDAVWKTSGALTTYAATTQAGFQVVPRNYDGGFLRVDDATCNHCH